MRAYLIRRALLVIPTLLLVTIIVFMLVRFIPGDVLDMMISEMSEQTGEEFANIDALRRQLGLDKPIPIQYARWLGIWPQDTGEISGLLQGDLGKSLWTNEPIVDTLRQRLPVSIELGLFSMIIAYLIALPVGVFAATRQDSATDYSGRIFAIVMLSMPGFWLMTMVIVYPSIWWGTMPNIVYVPLTQDLAENLKQFLLPAFLTGAATSAMTMRLTRTMMLEVLRQDYIRTAWSKGLSERTVLVKHAVKNAFIPVITVMGARIPGILAGQVIIEVIFALPGVGRVLIGALNQRDYPIISGINVMIATVVLVMNVVVDITYAWLDPRIRYT
ncbi:Dipeptide transport system permease protein DppB [subsurface metagenome]